MCVFSYGETHIKDYLLSLALDKCLLPREMVDWQPCLPVPLKRYAISLVNIP